MDADSSFVVAQVVPALSVPCGPVQEWAPETWKWGSLTFVPCSLDCQPLPFPHDRRGHCWRAAEERNEPCCGDGLLGHCRPLPAGRCRGSPRGGGQGLALPLQPAQQDLSKAIRPRPWAVPEKLRRGALPGEEMPLRSRIFREAEASCPEGFVKLGEESASLDLCEKEGCWCRGGSVTGARRSPSGTSQHHFCKV